MSHHTSDPRCPLCEEKLQQAHPNLVSLFYWIKGNHPEVHIAWSFRSQLDQDNDYNTGKSKLKWPMSKHNFMMNGQPCSKALDLFQIINDQAIFDPVFYKELNDEIQAARLPFKWGGTFQSFPDLDHFELLNIESTVADS